MKLLAVATSGLVGATAEKQSESTKSMNAIPNEFDRLNLEPTPEPNVRVKRIMLAMGMEFEGLLDQDPTSLSALLQHNFVLPEANLLLVGTSCQRPLVTREAMSIATAVDMDLLIVRGADTPQQASFDVKLLASDLIFFAYRLWKPRPTGTAWLIPSAGEGPCFRLEQDGLVVDWGPPYMDWPDRHRGLEYGAEYLAIAAQGWF